MKKIIILISVFLIALGIGSIIYDQRTYRQEKILDIGPIKATVEKKPECARFPIYFGALVIISGIAIILLENKRTP